MCGEWVVVYRGLHVWDVMCEHVCGCVWCVDAWGGGCCVGCVRCVVGSLGTRPSEKSERGSGR